MVQQKCYTITRVKKSQFPHYSKEWAEVTACGYVLVAYYDLLGGRLHYSVPNEEHITLPRWNLDKAQYLTSSPPVLRPGMMTVFGVARERFNVNGWKIHGRRINIYPKINSWYQRQA